MRIKQQILIIILFIAGIGLTGCIYKSDNNMQNIKTSQLSAPSLSWDNGKISWNSIDNASKYEVSLNNEISYTYETSINIDVSEKLKHYDIKVKSISENPNYINSVFSNELKFDTIKLHTPYVSYKINHSKHLVSLNWVISSLYADSYEMYLNGSYHSTIYSCDITFKESNIADNIVCTYDLRGEIFNTGRNEFCFKAISNNKYYLSSNNSNVLWLEKNSQYTNIRVENGQLLYNSNLVYNIDYDAVTEEYDFPVINKDVPESHSAINPIDYTLWSDPVYVNLYRIHYPKIIGCNSNSNFISITIQGYDPRYVGTNPKKQLGYDYNKIEFIFYINESTYFSITKDSNCLDEEIFTIQKEEITNNNYSISNIKKIGVVAHKDGYVSSKNYIYEIGS